MTRGLPGIGTAGSGVTLTITPGIDLIGMLPTGDGIILITITRTDRVVT